MIHDTISNVGLWMEQLKSGGEFYNLNRQKLKNPRFKYLILDKLENLSFPPEIDAYETQLRLRVSATVYDIRTEQFISNSYKSPYLTIFLTDLVNMADNSDDEEINPNEIPLKKQVRSQPKQRSGQAITRYQHAAIWVGFIMDKAQYLKDYKLAIEFSLSQYSNKTKLTTTFKTLGYALIDLVAKITYADVYAGSVRDLTNGFYVREQKQLKPLSISYRWKSMTNVPTALMKLIGPYLLFGYDDNVIGVRGGRLTAVINELKYLEYDEALNLSFPKCKLMIHQVVDLEIYNFIKQQQVEQSQMEQSPQNVKVTKSKTRLIAFCHNGWREVNESGFENIYVLNEVEKDDKFTIFTTEKPIRTDRIYKDTAIIFQLVYHYDIEVMNIQQDPVEVDIGWFALTPNDCTRASEKLKLQIHGDRKTFNSNRWYAKLTPKSAGEAIIQYESAFFDNSKQEKKGNQNQKQKNQFARSYDPNSLKGRLIELSIKKKNEIKTGLAREENIMKQNKLIADLFTIKQNTTNLITGMINQNYTVQTNTQVLLHEFQGLIEVGVKNFELAKEKYQLEEQKLLNFRRRKEKLDNLLASKTEDLKNKFDKWQYEQPHHPNLEISYRSSLLDFYLSVGFGCRDMPSSRQVPMEIEQSRMLANLKITLQLTSYKFILKINSTIKEDYILPPIYQFDNYCPIQLFFKIHMLGQEDDIESHEARSQKEFERWVSDRMYMHLVFTKVIPEQNLADKIAIIEIWNGTSITLMGRCFVPLHQDSILFQESTVVCQHFKECDVISHDGNYIIGQLDVGVLVQYTDESLKSEEEGERPKQIILVEKKQEAGENESKVERFIPPSEYHDIIRIYYSGGLDETKVIINNPVMLNQQYLKYMKQIILKGDDGVVLEYFNDFELHFRCKVFEAAETFLLLYDFDKVTLLQVYRILVYNCESLTYTDYVGKHSVLQIRYESSFTDPIKIKPTNPFLIRPRVEELPVVIDHIYHIPIQCLAVEPFFLTTRFTIQQGDHIEAMLLHIKPKENKVTQLFNLECSRNQEKQQSILYRNKTDKAVMLQVISSNSALQLETQILKLEPFESAPITFVLRKYQFTKKQQIKLYFSNLEGDYIDSVMFKINYN